MADPFADAEQSWQADQQQAERREAVRRSAGENGAAAGTATQTKEDTAAPKPIMLSKAQFLAGYTRPIGFGTVSCSAALSIPTPPRQATARPHLQRCSARRLPPSIAAKLSLADTRSTRET